jgi:uncharacterized protein YuzE
MKVQYGDDIAYVQLGEGKVAETKEVAPGLLLDLDENGQALGLEIMGLEQRGLAQGVVEVELAQVELSEAERAGERKLAAAIFDAQGREGRAQAR